MSIQPPWTGHVPTTKQIIEFLSDTPIIDDEEENDPLMCALRHMTGMYIREKNIRIMLEKE